MCLVGDEDVVVLAPIEDFPRRSAHPASALTGGMGARAPAPGCDARLSAEVAERVVLPLLYWLRSTGQEYRGVLTVGLRVTEQSWMALEVNCHWGDPETQAALAAHDLRLIDVIDVGLGSPLGVARGAWGLSRPPVVCEAARPAVSLVLARAEYPHADRYSPITYRPDELDGLGAAFMPYEGQRADERSLWTTRGRFCSLTATGATMGEACAAVRASADRIRERCPDLEYNPAVCEPPPGAA